MSDSNDELRIDKEVPIPQSRGGSKYQPIADKMMIGDSVFFESYHRGACLVKALKSIRKNGICRKYGNGHRVWCVPDDYGENHQPKRRGRPQGSDSSGE